MSTTAGANTLSTDFDLMRSVAGTPDPRNEEIRAMLQTFIGRMNSVPPSVWGGLAAARFKDVVDRWNTESLRLHHALHTSPRPFGTTKLRCGRPARTMHTTSPPSAEPVIEGDTSGPGAVLQL